MLTRNSTDTAARAWLAVGMGLAGVFAVALAALVATGPLEAAGMQQAADEAAQGEVQPDPWRHFE